MKKRMIAGVLSVAMLSMTAMPVMAENSSMNVQYTQNTTYTLNIPAQINLSATDATKAEQIGVTAVNTKPTEKVQVKVKGSLTNSRVTLSRADDSSTNVVSTVTDKDGKNVSDGFVVAEFQDMSTEPITLGTGILNFSKVVDSTDNTAAIKAGTYTGTIIFEASVVSR